MAPRQQRKGHGRTTLRDVAAVAEVTAITVSRFLRQPGLVAEPTASRIRQALADTGYVPNKQAGQLASGRSRMVAALIPNLAHSIFGETVQGLADGLQAAGHELLLAATNYSTEREEAQLRALLGWGPGAVVVTGRRHSPGARALLRAAREAGTPVIEIWDQHPGADGFTQVGFDHAEVGRAMARHLLAAGHRVLAYVDSGVAEDFRAHERGAAFATTVRRAGAQVHSLRAAPGDAFDAGRQALAALRALPGARVSAAAFANDQLACGALLQAQAEGLAVPGELALIGFGDFPIGRQLQPALSTVRPPRYEIGRAAAEAVLQALADGHDAPHRRLDWALIERGSSAPSAGDLNRDQP